MERCCGGTEVVGESRAGVWSICGVEGARVGNRWWSDWGERCSALRVGKRAVVSRGSGAGWSTGRTSEGRAGSADAMGAWGGARRGAGILHAEKKNVIKPS